MRTQLAVLGLMVGAMVGCSDSPKASPNPGLSRFIGQWDSAPGPQTLTLVVQPDQHARLIPRSGNAKPVEYRGTCTPGSDTLTFVEDAAKVGNPPPAQRILMFATRPDGSLATTFDGVPFRLNRK